MTFVTVRYHDFKGVKIPFMRMDRIEPNREPLTPNVRLFFLFDMAQFIINKHTCLTETHRTMVNHGFTPKNKYLVKTELVIPIIFNDLAIAKLHLKAIKQAVEMDPLVLFKIHRV